MKTPVCWQPSRPCTKARWLSVGALLDASHASLRDLYECSTPAVEVAVRALKEAGALGARLVGGGFGGHVWGFSRPAPPRPLPRAR